MSKIKMLNILYIKFTLLLENQILKGWEWIMCMLLISLSKKDKGKNKKDRKNKKKIKLIDNRILITIEIK